VRDRTAGTAGHHGVTKVHAGDRSGEYLGTLNRRCHHRAARRIFSGESLMKKAAVPPATRINNPKMSQAPRQSTTHLEVSPRIAGAGCRTPMPDTAMPEARPRTCHEPSLYGPTDGTNAKPIPTPRHKPKPRYTCQSAVAAAAKMRSAATDNDTENAGRTRPEPVGERTADAAQ